jgi:Mg2+ and Co2+ transporter CorA
MRTWIYIFLLVPILLRAQDAVDMQWEITKEWNPKGLAAAASSNELAPIREQLQNEINGLAKQRAQMAQNSKVADLLAIQCQGAGWPSYEISAILIAGPLAEAEGRQLYEVEKLCVQLQRAWKSAVLKYLQK